MSFDHVIETAYVQTITLLYIYLCVWGLDLRLNNVNYSYWYFLLSTIIISLYWISEPPLSSSITTSEYLIYDTSDGKGQQFLDLVDSNFNIIELSYTKGGLWLQLFSHSNLLCACATRVITNHAPIDKYWLRFFPKEEFKCFCGNFPIESRRHILHDCMRFNRYWNPR